MARRFKPQALRLLTGSRRPGNPNEPRAVGDLAAAPSWFTEGQVAIWDYASKHAPAGLLKQCDRSVLAVWCVAVDLHQQASQRVAQTGLLVKTAEGAPIPSPYLQIAAKQSLILLRAAALLGFSPCSRASITLHPDGGAGPFSNNGKRPDPAA